MFGFYPPQKYHLASYLSIAIILLGTSACSGQAPDVTEQLQILGKPMAVDGKTGRALNVWDLQEFAGKIYIAGGSTVSNAGPINVWAYNPAKQILEKEFTVQEEAIEQFKVFDRALYIPAADPQRGDTNKFYRRTTQEPWKLYQSAIPGLAHVRDLIKAPSGDILLVGNNRLATKDPSQPATAITLDQGISFKGAGLDNVDDAAANWFFSIFAYRGRIYAPSSLLRDTYNRTGVIGVYKPKRRIFELSQTLKNDEFIPSILLGPQLGPQGPTVIYRPWQPVAYKGFLLYPVRSYSYSRSTYESAYMNSIGFFIKRNMGLTPSAVIFPDGKAIGEDVLLKKNELYALANTKTAPDEFWVYVYKTSAPASTRNWQEVLRFKSRNKARSFEFLDNTFYFGLGQDYDDLVGESGTILKVEL